MFSRAEIRNQTQKKDVIKVAKLHREKMIRGCQESEKVCKIFHDSEKITLNEIELSTRFHLNHQNVGPWLSFWQLKVLRESSKRDFLNTDKHSNPKTQGPS